MKMVTICGDMHLTAITPKSRIDNYAESCIEKLENLHNMMVQTGSKLLIIEGDVFHTYRQPIEFVNKVMKVLNAFKKDGISIYSIIGNHDVPNENCELIEKTALGTLFESGIITHASHVNVPVGDKSFCFVLNDYKTPIPLAPKDSSIVQTALVSHSYYDFELAEEETLHEDDIKDLGYDMFFFGHDHTPYKDTTILSSTGLPSTLYRCGSFTRGTAHGYQVNRSIEVFQIELADNGLVNVMCKPVACKAPELIFPAHVLDKVKLSTLKELQVSFDELVSKVYDSEDNVVDIYSILDGLEINKDVRYYIETMLRGRGILRREGVVC